CSPYIATLVVAAQHRVRGPASERCRELRHVRQRSIHAETRQRMRIGRDLQSLALFAHVLCPHLRPSEEEALFGIETVDRFAWLSFLRLPIRRVRDLQPAEVRDAFAENEVAGHVLAADVVAAELLRHTLRAL